MQTARPVQSNATDCRLLVNVSGCNANGVCSEKTGWCECALGYSLLTACATPFFEDLSLGVRYGAVALAFFFYGGLISLSAIECLHHYLARGVRGTLHPSNFSAWVTQASLLFYTLRCAAYALLLADFVGNTAQHQAAATIVNTVTVTMLSCVFVLATTLWMNLIETAKGLGTISRQFRALKITNLVIMGVFDIAGFLCAVLSALRILPDSFQSVAQVLGTIGTVLPLLITIYCLIRLVPFLRQLKEAAGGAKPTHVVVLFQKTRWMVVLIVELVLVFALTFALGAFDAVMPDVMMLRYYVIPVSDMIFMPTLLYFAQKYIHGPSVPLFRIFFDFSQDVHSGSAPSETTAQSSGKKEKNSGSALSGTGAQSSDKKDASTSSTEMQTEVVV